MKDFAFDVPLLATIHVPAANETEARALLREKLNGADTNFGAWPDGTPILGEVGIDGMEELVGSSKDKLAARAAQLARMKADGLTIGECITALAVADDDVYVKAARSQLTNDDVEIDDKTTTSVGENGAWVLAWLWVSNAAAGLIYADLLEAILTRARIALQGAHGLDPVIAQLRRYQADWLEDLIANFADELDDIESTVPVGLPGSITWLGTGQEAEEVSFMPSDAIAQLLLLAKANGLGRDLAEKGEQFCLKYGNKLDAILTVVQTA